MDKPVFKHIEDRAGNPLIVWTNPPGLFAELTPAQVRTLAGSLLASADYSERQHHAAT